MDCSTPSRIRSPAQETGGWAGRGGQWGRLVSRENFAVDRLVSGRVVLARGNARIARLPGNAECAHAHLGTPVHTHTPPPPLPQAQQALACLQGGVQLAQTRVDLGVHLPLARHVLGEGVAVGGEGLADLRGGCIEVIFASAGSAAQLLNTNTHARALRRHMPPRKQKRRNRQHSSVQRAAQCGAARTLRILALARSPAKNTTNTAFSTFSPVAGSGTEPTCDRAGQSKG